jgi:hypothetical protein
LDLILWDLLIEILINPSFGNGQCSCAASLKDGMEHLNTWVSRDRTASEAFVRPYLFVVTKDIQGEILWCMLFAPDVDALRHARSEKQMILA